MQSLKRSRVAILLDLRTSFERRLVRGIATASANLHWEILFEAWGEINAHQLSHHSADGAIAAITDPTLLQRLQQQGLPVVNVSNILPDLELPAVYSDNLAIGRLAADHFLERGFRHFCFLGHPHVAYSDDRKRGFLEKLSELGLSGKVQVTPVGWSQSWGGQRQKLERWLPRLPKPCALFVVNDIPARRVLQTCRDIGIPVPQQLAVLGVGDYELHNQLAPIPLSSVVQAAERIGFLAANTLEQLMRGEPGQSPVLVQPAGIVTRQSSDTAAVDHPGLTRALEFIRQEVARGLRVGDVAEHLAVSRRWLEQHFRAQLGRTPKSEIRRAQVDLARRLLVETDWPLAIVARQCGLKTAQRLSVVFRRAEGVPPSIYREQLRQSE